MTVALPGMSARIERLPKDERGYPVPRFVEWLTEVGRDRARPGEEGAHPDFRYADYEFRARAFKTGLCWVCGERLGAHRVFVIGPMCVISRTTMEPACHRDCAEFAAQACPFLVSPRRKRNAKGLDPEASAPGIMLSRNPGCVCLYETKEASAFDDGAGGWLIRLGDPARVDWWAEGRRATRAEIAASIDSGYPLLEREARRDGVGAVDELARQAAAALKLLPAA
jgi:hypothetical protein